MYILFLSIFLVYLIILCACFILCVVQTCMVLLKFVRKCEASHQLCCLWSNYLHATLNFATLFAAFIYSFLFSITVNLATRHEQEVCNEFWSANFVVGNTVIVGNTAIVRAPLVTLIISPNTTESLTLLLLLLPPTFYHCINFLPTPVSAHTQNQSLLVVKRDSKNYSKLCQVCGQ